MKKSLISLATLVLASLFSVSALAKLPAPSDEAKAKAAEPAAPKAADANDRGPMFDRRDVNKDGKLSKEEFMDKQKDPAQAAENYLKFDKDKDSFLTKEEFVKMGK